MTPLPEHEAKPAMRRILWARGFRDFGDGLVAVLLPAWLLALGYGAAEIGAVSTLALLGSALMTLGVGASLRADGKQSALLSLEMVFAAAHGVTMPPSIGAGTPWRTG